MKQILLSLTLLLIGLLPASAVKKFQPNPINVAAVIVEKTDSAKVASTCEYYGFKYQGLEDGYTVMRRPNDNEEIRLTFRNNGTPQKYPTIVIKARGSHKEIEELLKDVNFEKEGNTYTAPHNQYSRYITQCIKESHNILIFSRPYNYSHK